MISQNDRILEAMAILQQGRLSLFTAFLRILDPSQKEFSTHRDRFYATIEGQPTGKTGLLLDEILRDACGKTQLHAWMEPHAIQYVSDTVYDEMDVLKCKLRAQILSITPESLMDWDIMTIKSKISKHTPVLDRIIMSAAQSNRAIRENTVKDCTLLCKMLITQLARFRSNRSLAFAAPFSLFLWCNGASRQTIEVLAKCGFSVSFTCLLDLLGQLASCCVDRAVRITKAPHIFAYDNINISMSIHVEQRAGGPAKVQSGTFPVIYEITDGCWEHMQLRPILKRAWEGCNLAFKTDIRPTDDQIMALDGQLRVHVIGILFKFSIPFATYSRQADPLFRHQSR